jgi:O-antigen ligase
VALESIEKMTSVSTIRGGAVAMVAAGVTVWMLCRCKIKALLLVSSVLILAGVMFIGTDYWQKFADIWQDGPWKSTVDSRLDLWEGGWRMALEYPVVGVGLGNFEHRVGEYTPSGKDDSPHNNVVAFLAETGFVGAVLYVTVFASALCLGTIAARDTTDPRRRWFATFLVASLVAYLVGGMFMTRHTMPLAYLLAGSALAVSVNGVGWSTPARNGLGFASGG